MALVVIAALVPAGCADDDGGSESRPDAGPTTDRVATTLDASSLDGTGRVLAATADERIIPAYRDLAAGLDELAATVDELCAEPGDDELDAARQAWREASRGWQRSRPGAVGPASERRLMSAVGFGARATSITELLDGTDPVDAAALDEQGATVRGLYAAEVALFGDDADRLAGADGERRCAYTAAVVELAGTAAAEVLGDWTGSFRDTFAVGMDGSPQVSVSALVNEVTNGLRELDEKGLRDLAGADSPDDLAEARRDGPAGHGLADRRALAEGIIGLVGDGDVGIVALVADRSPETAARLSAAAAEVDEAVGALPDSVDSSFADPGSVQRAADAVAELKVLVATEVASQLGVTISFSDSDGDG